MKLEIKGIRKRQHPKLTWNDKAVKDFREKDLEKKGNIGHKVVEKGNPRWKYNDLEQNWDEVK